ncbi:MAG TPA: CRTAC1 family protein, partial [Gemmataceae bacterium]|nr:CRTAC1 family protein [Gemmataceae bacterium]
IGPLQPGPENHHMDAPPAGNAGNRPRKAGRILLLLAGPLGVIVALGVMLALGKGPFTPRPTSIAYRERSLLADDSGAIDVWYKYFAPSVRDPLDLEHIRDCFLQAPERGILATEKKLAEGNLSPSDRFDSQLDLVRILLFKGEAAKASELLQRVRDEVEKKPELRDRLPWVIYLQGIAALRRGETENCVHCPCEHSCIFPILPGGIHLKREGSTEAIRYFIEYLDYFPDDMGVRWLLNVAAMTLGEYPDQVPEKYRIPLEPFQSKADIGRFTDIAPQLGLDRLNLGGNAIMEDFHNNGLLDILVSTWDLGLGMKFYRNRGDGTFEDRSKMCGLDKEAGVLYCVQGDYNNDGYLDVYACRGAWLMTPMRPSLLRNNGDGTFTDVTKEAGLLTPVDGQVAAWADYDNDGHLDLFVGSELGRCLLYHNRGDGTFEEVALQAGIDIRGVAIKGAAWCDFDGDRFPDLVVSSFSAMPRFYRNNRNGTFTEVSGQMGIVGPENAFSCWFFDYDNDGWPDLFVAGFETNLAEVVRSQLGLRHKGTTCRLYRNMQGKRFRDVTKEVGLDVALPIMGSNFADFDNDGYLDIYLGTGAPAYSMLVPNRMFKNDRGKRFLDITASSGTGHLQKGHGVACGDWDHDGNVDVFIQIGGAAQGDAFRNALFQNPGNHGNHWIVVKLVGKKTNRAAIGARIKLTLPGNDPATIYRHVTSGSSYGANPLQQHIGIGKATKVDTLEIYWPTSDTRQVFRDVAVDQAIEITEFEQKYRRLNYTRLPAPKKNGPAVAGQ